MSTIQCRNTGLVTIILTTLNSDTFLARSIESCLNQTYSNLELLVVDGGSTDHTLEIVRSYTDSRIRLIHQEGNHGKLPGALNLGMAESLGEFITWTQDDCWYEPNAVATLVEYLKAHQKISLVYSDYWVMDDKQNPLKYERVNSPDFILVDDVIRMSFLFRREVYELIGPQEIEFFPIHEIPWRLKIVEHFDIAPLHVPLMYYTLHERSLTGRIGNWQLRRDAVSYLWEHNYIDRTAYRTTLAQIDMDRAYDEFILSGHFAEFWQYALSAIGRDWRFGLSRGLWRMMLASALPSRDRYRRRLLANRRIDDLSDYKSC